MVCTHFKMLLGGSWCFYLQCIVRTLFHRLHTPKHEQISEVFEQLAIAGEILCFQWVLTFFPGKCALTLIHQFQCWGKVPVKFAVHKSTVYRVGLNGLDPFIKLCDFFFSKQPGTTICNMDFHNEQSGNSCCHQQLGTITGAEILRIHLMITWWSNFPHAFSFSIIFCVVQLSYNYIYYFG